MNTDTRVLVTGATGFIGSHLVGALRAAGYRVIGGARHPAALRQRFPDLEVRHMDFSRDPDTAGWREQLADVDIVINTVGIIREGRGHTFERVHRDAPIALFDACEQTGVRRIIQISALGAAADAPTRFLRTKAAADRHLARLTTPSTILRPSLVHGPGALSSALLKALAALPVIPLPGNGDQPVQPIHIDDLTRAVLRCLETTGPDRECLAAVGPQPLTFRTLLTELRTWLGYGPARFLPLSMHGSQRLAGLAGRLGIRAIDSDTFTMLAQGNQAEAAPFIARVGFTPRSVRQALEQTPAWQADRWHARLTPLRAPLRWSLGLLWLISGVVSAGLYPIPDSLALLGRVGIAPDPAPFVLASAVLLDMALGIATLTGYRLRLVYGIQILAMLCYTAIITVHLPELWLHPFGPVTKNLPLLIATLALLATEERA